MSSASSEYENEAPAPLTDRERALLKRMFSDFFEVPGEWKTALKAELEKDPPVLGKYTLGGQAPSLQPNSVLSIHILDGAIVDQDISAANKDGLPSVPSLRTLGTGAQQAAAGNDPRLRAPQIVTGWGSDNLPAAAGNGPVVRVPYVSGVAVTFTLKRAFARVETPGGAATTFTVERSTAGGAFTPTTIETLTIPASSYSVEDAAPTAWTVTSGNELRLVFGALGTTGPYQVQLQWES